jgi:hypothetical protein
VRDAAPRERSPTRVSGENGVVEVLAFGPPAFVLGAAVAAATVRQWRHLLVALCVGLAAIVGASVVGLSQVESTGSEDFGAGALIALLGGSNAIGSTVGVGLGSIWGMQRAPRERP